MLAREEGSYHSAARVRFQETAWTARPTALAMLKQTTLPWVKEKHGDLPWLLYMDQLDAQRHIKFVSEVKANRGHCMFGPSGRTDAWQPVDLQCGAVLKSLDLSCLIDKLEAFVCSH